MKPESRRIFTVTTLAAAAISGIMGLGLPVIYWAISYTTLAGSLATEVEFTASQVTQVVNANPEMWRFDSHQLERTLRPRAPRGEEWRTGRVLDEAGAEIAAVTSGEGLPPVVSLTKSHPIFDSGRPVGTLEIRLSLLPLLIRTVFFALLGAALGGGFFLLLHAVPLRALARTLERLDQEHHWYQALFNGNNDMAFVTDASDPGQARIVQANRMAAQRLGYSLEELTGVPASVITVPGTLPSAGELGPRLRRKGTAVFETVLAGRGGRRIPVEVNARILLREGRPMLLSVCRDIATRKASEEATRRSLTEKETMLKEIHHRVKNNLQVISGMLDLERHFVRQPEDREVFRESQARIRTMALVHERLYRSETLDDVDMRPYLAELTRSLMESFSLRREGVEIILSVDDARMSPDTVIPLGLIVNELVSNSLKHGFPARAGGRVEVRLRSLPGGSYEMAVEDDGAGLPQGFDPGAAKSLGVKLIVLLAGQMGSDHRFGPGAGGKGTAFSMRFREYHEADTTLTGPGSGGTG